MTNMDTPLSAVSINFPWFLLNPVIAWASSLLMFGLGGVGFFNICFIWPLTSTTSPCFIFWHTLSICAMYSPVGGSLVTTAKLGPWARTFSWASVHVEFVRLCTHLFSRHCFLLWLLLMFLFSMFNHFFSVIFVFWAAFPIATMFITLTLSFINIFLAFLTI